jgi:xyloglucan-specific exo-beta-1,4-glucanase
MVTYGIVSQWPNGFQGQVTVMNHGASAVNGWELTWSFANGQQITQLWSGIDEQVGPAVSVRNESWNGTIAVDGSVQFGFLASWSGTNARPTAFSLNGTACTVT